MMEVMPSIPRFAPDLSIQKALTKRLRAALVFLAGESVIKSGMEDVDLPYLYNQDADVDVIKNAVLVESDECADNTAIAKQKLERALDGLIKANALHHDDNEAIKEAFEELYAATITACDFYSYPQAAARLREVL